MKRPALNRCILVWGIALLVIPLRLLAISEPAHRSVEPWASLSNISGYASMSIFVVAIILLAPWKFMDTLIGKKGQRLCLHHQLGWAVIILAVLHALLLTVRFLPDDMNKALLSFLPTHKRWEVNVGVYALYGLILTLGAVSLRGVPTLWKWIHRTSVIWIILAAVHTQYTGPDWSSGLWLNMYMWILYVLGFIAITGKWMQKLLQTGTRRASTAKTCY